MENWLDIFSDPLHLTFHLSSAIYLFISVFIALFSSCFIYLFINLFISLFIRLFYQPFHLYLFVSALCKLGLIHFRHPPILLSISPFISLHFILSISSFSRLSFSFLCRFGWVHLLCLTLYLPIISYLLNS